MTPIPPVLNTKNHKRVITREKLLKQQIIEHTKKLVLSSKIILDEDFDVLENAPLIFLPHIIKNQPCLSVALSATTFVLLSKFNNFKLHKNLFLSLLPIGCELLNQGIHCWDKYKCFRAVENFVKYLEEQASLNKKILRHLKMRMMALADLQNKLNVEAFNMLQTNDLKYAQETYDMLTKVCKTLQKQLVIQAEYSSPQYTFMGQWNFETCSENPRSFYEVSSCIENLSELYILLASNLMGSSVFALETVFWQLENNFYTVFNTIVVVGNLLKETTKKMERVFKEMSSTLEKPTEIIRKSKKEDKKLSVYSEALEECKNRVRVIYQMADSLQEQNSQTRCVFLEEMLENFEISTVLVRNLLRYEKSLVMVDHDHDEVREDIKNFGYAAGEPNLMIVNDKEAEIGSDDEEFAYSPRDSNNEFDQNHPKNQENLYEDYEIAKKSVAVQNLMLQELRNRMKDVRRIKISRTPAGDLIVQERPETLQESGGQNIPSLTTFPEIITSSLNICPNEVSSSTSEFPIELPPPPPPFGHNLPKFQLSEDILNNFSACSALQQNVNKSLLASISSLAQQRNQREDIFGCDGDEYVPTDESSEDETC